MGGRDEVRDRIRAEEASGRTIGGAVLSGIGLVMVAIGVGLGVSIGHAGGMGIGILLAAVGVGLGLIGVYNLRDVSRTAELHASGLSGRGTIKSYKRSLAGYDLVLRIDVPDRPSYDVTLKNQASTASESVRVSTGSEVSVRVSPVRAQDVIIEWF